MMLRHFLPLDGAREQRPFGLGVEIGDQTTATQAVNERLAQPSFGQIKLVFGGVEFGDLLAHKGLAAE